MLAHRLPHREDTRTENTPAPQSRPAEVGVRIPDARRVAKVRHRLFAAVDGMPDQSLPSWTLEGCESPEHTSS